MSEEALIRFGSIAGGGWHNVYGRLEDFQLSVAMEFDQRENHNNKDDDHAVAAVDDDDDEEEEEEEEKEEEERGKSRKRRRRGKRRRKRRRRTRMRRRRKILFWAKKRIIIWSCSSNTKIPSEALHSPKLFVFMRHYLNASASDAV
ncbi:hypothetical protein DPMN_179525 [Dreissena polymorpha]|uniref:Uncharacterized protein n=1 Tax=Dreissena polymorpha TaxID=45954 RepID=A0A9D4IMF0_DREPO|nr:hypothetical protein DPMN_179525 [Dreissena polymorpha]